MQLLQIILFSAAILLTLYNLIIYIGLNRKITIAPGENGISKFSIIIAAKNEEKNVPQLITSLKALEYQPEYFEVIIIDDNSIDNTFKVCSELTLGLTNYHTFQASDKMYPGKKGALNFGISIAKYPFILITDADCKPMPGWLQAFSAMFNKGYDFIFGVAPFDEGPNIVNKISRFENLRSSLLTFSYANLGFPYSAAARNFGFKKTSFEKIKGYRNTIETLSGDDDLLLREAIKNRMKIGTLAESNSFVYSSTMNNFKSYIKQRSRHTKTSLYYLPSRQIIISFWHILNIACTLSFFLFMLNPFLIIPFLVKILLDIVTVMIYQNKFGYKFKLIEILYLQFLYEAFLIINFTGAIFRNDAWN